MRIQSGQGVAVEAAYRKDARYGGSGIEHLEAQSRALPAREATAVERRDLIGVRGYEIVIELLIVVFDGVEQIAACGPDRAHSDNQKQHDKLQRLRHLLHSPKALKPSGTVGRPRSLCSDRPGLQQVPRRPPVPDPTCGAEFIRIADVSFAAACE